VGAQAARCRPVHMLIPVSEACGSNVAIMASSVAALTASCCTSAKGCQGSCTEGVMHVLILFLFVRPVGKACSAKACITGRVLMCLRVHS